MSDLEKLDKYISELPAGTYVCELLLNYYFDHNTQRERTILIVDIDGNATWLDDWYEGQQRIILSRCINIEDLKI